VIAASRQHFRDRVRVVALTYARRQRRTCGVPLKFSWILGHMKQFQMHDVVKVIKVRNDRFDQFTPWAMSKRPPRVGDVGVLVTIPVPGDPIAYCGVCGGRWADSLA
jgi:hypothetical protein